MDFFNCLFVRGLLQGQELDFWWSSRVPSDSGYSIEWTAQDTTQKCLAADAGTCKVMESQKKKL